jgi:hypothetical protein
VPGFGLGVRLPAALAPGRYRLVVVMNGAGTARAVTRLVVRVPARG